MNRIVILTACLLGLSYGATGSVQQPDLNKVLARIAGQPSGIGRLIIGGQAYSASLDSRGLVLRELHGKAEFVYHLDNQPGLERQLSRVMVSRAPAAAKSAGSKPGEAATDGMQLSPPFLLDTGLVRVAPDEFQVMPAAAFDGTNYLVVWEDWRNESDLYCARVAANGSVLDQFPILVSAAEGHQSYPQVAFDGTNYLVVWEDWRRGVYSDIYGARVSTSGTVLDPNGLPITAATDDQTVPAVAFDGENYLVVWQDYRNGSNNDVYGGRVTPQGVPLDGDGFAVYSTDNQQVSVHVAHGGDNCLVTWADWFGSLDSSYVDAARVNRSGSVLDPAGVHVSTGSTHKGLPVVAFDGTNFLVAWIDDPGMNVDIYGSRVSTSAEVLDPAGLKLTARTEIELSPTIAYDGLSYVIAWEDMNGSTAKTDIFCVRVSPDGAVRDPSGLPVCTDPGHQHTPSIATDGINSFILWEDARRTSWSDIYAARVNQQGEVLDPDGFRLSGAANDQQTPAPAFDGTNYLVVWADNRNGDYDIFGTRVNSSGVPLDPGRIAISVAPSDQLKPAVAFDGTNYLVTWEDYRGANAPDIYAARVTKSGAVLDPSGIVVSSQDSEQVAPDVAFDGTNYLVVWQDDRAGIHWDDIYGARITPAGAVLDADGLLICSAMQWQVKPSVAFDGTNYLVVWEDHCDLDTADIRGARVSRQGSLVDAQPLHIADAPGNQLNPRVAWNGSCYLVVWQDCRGGSHADIYGCRVGPDGSLLDSGGAAISTAGNSQLSPDVIFDDTAWVVIWADSADGKNTRLGGACINDSMQLTGGFSLTEMSSDMLNPVGALGPGRQVLFAYTGFTTTVDAKDYNARRAWGVFYKNVESVPGLGPGWHRLADVPTTHKRVKQGAGLTALGKKVFVMLGNNTREFYEYDVETHSWRRLPDVPAGTRGRNVRKGSCIANDGFSVYVMKGQYAHEFYRYDPAADTWTALAEPGFVKHIKGGSMAFDGTRRLYLAAGAGDREWKAFDVFDRTWSTPSPDSLPEGKWKIGSSLVGAGDRLYGLRAGGKTNEFYELDLSAPARAWVRMPDMPLYNPGLKRKKIKEGAGSAFDGAGLYATKGGNTFDFYSFDPAADSWHQREDVGMPEGVPTKRIKSGGALCSSPVAGGLFALVGNNTNDFWFYVPRPGGTDGSGPQAAARLPGQEPVLTVWPNPARGRTVISMARNLRGPAVGRVYDPTGRMVFEAETDQSSIELPAGRLKPGVYIVRIVTGGTKSERKLVIAK